MYIWQFKWIIHNSCLKISEKHCGLQEGYKTDVSTGALPENNTNPWPWTVSLGLSDVSILTLLICAKNAMYYNIIIFNATQLIHH